MPLIGKQLFPANLMGWNMLIKVREASGAALDWMVAKCEGYDLQLDDETSGHWLVPQDGFLHDEKPLSAFRPSTNWSQGGPIIERENIFIMKNSKNEWVSIIHRGSPIGITGLTPLIAAMRCYVTRSLGDEVEVPYGLA